MFCCNRDGISSMILHWKFQWVNTCASNWMHKGKLKLKMCVHIEKNKGSMMRICVRMPYESWFGPSSSRLDWVNSTPCTSVAMGLGPSSQEPLDQYLNLFVIIKCMFYAINSMAMKMFFVFVFLFENIESKLTCGWQDTGQIMYIIVLLISYKWMSEKITTFVLNKSVRNTKCLKKCEKSDHRLLN